MFRDDPERREGRAACMDECRSHMRTWRNTAAADVTPVETRAKFCGHVRDG